MGRFLSAEKILEAEAVVSTLHGPSTIMDSDVWYPVSFADIFKNNSMNIGILPVQVSDAFLEKIFQSIEADPKSELVVDLPQQKITIVATGESESFSINGYKKHNLMNGFDDIDFLQDIKGEIGQFAQSSRY